MTDERLTQIFYRLMRDYVSLAQLEDCLNETSDNKAVFSDHDIESDARSLVAFL